MGAGTSQSLSSKSLVGLRENIESQWLPEAWLMALPTLQPNLVTKRSEWILDRRWPIAQCVILIVRF